MVSFLQRMHKGYLARKLQVDVDFATSPRRPSKSEIGLGLAAMVVWIVLGWFYQILRQEHETQQVLGQHLQQQLEQARDKQQPVGDMQLLQAQRMHAATVLNQLSIPWDALFHVLENAYDDKVTLITVEPDASRKDVLITAEAADWASMLNYVGQLRQSESLRNAHLTGHQVNLQDPQRPVRFTVLAQWAGFPSPGAPSPSVELKPSP